ncbi:helix-turn-helix domain-containing protein [Pseudomonas viridiflava]|uniref:helix-turn-helix domain-containing protein n=1 Tax=Pseudomonas viridiflava TaxID=33069 RepID=UPI002ECA1262|nr:helix-turn-helix domain-containing protein [Pseudomonas viridiflava]
MATHFINDRLPAKQRFGCWRELVSSTYGLVASQPLNDAPFDGVLDIKTRNDVAFTHIESVPITYERAQGDAQSDHFLVSLSFCPLAVVTQNGRESRQVPGDIVIYDSARPYTCSYPQGDDQIVLTVPRDLLLHHIPQAERLLCRTLERQSPLGRLAANLLTEIWNSQTVPASLESRLNASFLDVLSTAFESACPDTGKTHQQRQLQSIKQFLLTHLSDPELTIEHVSQANHVSPRTLNRLFAREGTTAIRWLWQQRLSTCHDALLRGQFRQVSEAALSFGFSNLSHFSRVFKNAYGMSPQQLLKR